VKKNWLPKLLTVIFICFLSLFSLDVIVPNSSVPQIIIGLFMHNIPSLILLFALMVAWKKPKTGGVLFMILSVGFFLWVRGFFAVFGLAVLFTIGSLFLLQAKKSGK
jgi:hypothetical protein